MLGVKQQDRSREVWLTKIKRNGYLYKGVNMTKDELMKLGLSEEVADKVVEDYGKNYVSKDQFNAKNDKLKSVEGELSKVRGEIDNLQKANASNDELKKQIDALKADSDKRTAEYEAKIKSMEIDSIVNAALSGVKSKNNKAVRALLDLTDAQVENGEIKGLKKQLDLVVKENPYLFGDNTKPVGTPAGNDGGKGTPQVITTKDFVKMSYADRTKLFEENKDLYNQLSKGEN